MDYKNGIGLTFSGVEVAKMLGCSSDSINRYRKELDIKAPMCRRVMNRFVYTWQAVVLMSEQTGRRVRGMIDNC